MQAKSGTKIEPVKPTEPSEAFDADEADPGTTAKVKAKQVNAQKGKYGQTKTPAFKPKDATSSSSAANSSTASANTAASTSANNNAAEEEEVETTFIAIKLIDEEGNAVVGEKYEVELPDGSVSKGTLDTDGTAKVEGFEAGQCKVRFPNLEDDSVSAK